MKKLISLLIVAAMMLAMFSVTAFAAGEEQAEPTVGPADSVYMYGGARTGIYFPQAGRYSYVVNYDYDEGKLTVRNDAIAGMTYDLESNTLTVDNVHQKANILEVWYMGNDFKLNVVGECEFGMIRVLNPLDFHSTSLNIIGSGTLTVNEEKLNNTAIQLATDGSSPIMGLDIADTVTVNLYSMKDEGEEEEESYYTLDPDEEYYPVVTLNRTSFAPANGGITVGGQPAPEAKSKQIVEKESDMIPTIEVEDRDEENVRGTQVKLKSGEDGVYSMGIMDGVIYLVSKYIYVEQLDLWIVDRDFADKGFVGKRYTKEEFEAQYEFVEGMAPTKVDYVPGYRVDSRGNEGIKMTKDGDVYIAQPTGAIWDWPNGEYQGNFYIKRVLWDEAQEYYVEDTSFEPIDLMYGELEENGFTIERNYVFRRDKLTVWSSGDPEDTERWDFDADVMNRASDPDGLYVRTGTYGDYDNPTGILVQPVHYNPETEEHYVEISSFEEPECYYVPIADLESGESDFSYSGSEVGEYVYAYYLPKNYTIERDQRSAVQLKEKDKPDVDNPPETYAYTHSQHYRYDETTGKEYYDDEYTLIKLKYDEKLGSYVEDSSFDEIDFYNLDDLDDLGYTTVLSKQPLDLVTKGSVYLSEGAMYTDNDGKTYYADYGNNVYEYNDEDVITLFGKTYHFGTPREDMSIAELNSTEHDVVTDNYSYWISGPEYHHDGGAKPEPTKGPYKDFFWMTGGAIIHFSDKNDLDAYVFSRKGNEEQGEFVINNEAVPGATYDLESNTLTINNLNLPEATLEVFYMGDDFTLDVEGECELGDISVRNYFGLHSTSLNITGAGALAVNEDKTEDKAIYMYGEGDSNFMHLDIADSVTLNCYAKESVDPAKPAHVIEIWSSVITPEENGAITVAGQTVPEAENEQNTNTEIDDYRYWITGSEYHHAAGEPQAEMFTLSGSLTTFLSDEEYVYVSLLSDEGLQINAMFEGSSDSYEIKDLVPAGSYTVTVNKKNHVERQYSITVSGDTELDIKILPPGDANEDGEVTTLDYARANAAAKGVRPITDPYILKVADVVGDDSDITTLDAARINAAAKGVRPLW